MADADPTYQQRELALKEKAKGKALERFASAFVEMEAKIYLKAVQRPPNYTEAWVPDVPLCARNNAPTAHCAAGRRP